MNDRPDVNASVSEKVSLNFQVAQAEVPAVNTPAVNSDAQGVGPNPGPNPAPVPATEYPQTSAAAPFAVDKGPIDLTKVKQTIVPVAGKPVVLPPDLQLSGIMVNGDDLVIKAANGDLIVIQGGLKALPSLVIGTVEIPAAALIASLQVGGVTLPAAGPAAGQTAAADAATPAAPGSSGGNFARGPGGIGDAFQIRDLLDFSERSRSIEKKQLEDGLLVAKVKLPPAIITINDGEPLSVEDPDVQGGTVPVGDGTGNDEYVAIVEITAGTGTVNEIKFGPVVTTPIIVTGMDLEALALLTWESQPTDDPKTDILVGLIEGIPVIRLTLSLTSEIEPTATGNATLLIELLEAFPHAEGADAALFSGVPIVITDSLGQTANGVTSFVVADDMPTVEIAPAVADETPKTDSIAEDGPNLTGKITLVEGADQDAVLVISGSGFTSMTFTLDGESAVTQSKTVMNDADELGVLSVTVNADGTASWTFNPSLESEGTPSFSFTATITDADGDVDSDTHTITITDGNNPTVGEPLSLTVDEKGLDNANALGSAEGAPLGDELSTVERNSGSLTFTAGSDDITSIKFADPNAIGNAISPDAGLNEGVTITWVMADDGRTLTGSIGGVEAVVLTLTGGETANAGGGTVSPTVTATLTDNFPHQNDLNALNLILSGIKVMASEADGDSISGSVTVTVIDDQPSVSAVANTGVTVALDETATTSTAAVINTGTIVKGDDAHVSGTGYISTTASSGALVTVTAAFGADGPAATGQTSYALSVIDAASGVTLTDGTAINLQLVGGVVVGVVASGTFAGQAAFAISINAITGVVTVEQYLSLDHPTEHNGTAGGSSYDETIALAAGSLGITVTVTDGDGDKAVSDPVSVGPQITFDDDGPTLTLTLQQGALLVVDETDGVVTAIGSEVDPVVGGNLGVATILGTALFTETAGFGADGAAAANSKTFALTLSAPDVPSGFLDSQTDQAIKLVVGAGGVIEGRLVTSGELAFTISVNGLGDVTLTQIRAIEHTVTTNHDELSGGMTAGVLTLTETLKDGDGDTISASVDLGSVIKFEDDGPMINAGDSLFVENSVGDIDVGLIGYVAGADGFGDLAVTGVTADASGVTILHETIGDVTISYYMDGVVRVDLYQFEITDKATGAYEFTVLSELPDPDPIPLVFTDTSTGSHVSLVATAGTTTLTMTSTKTDKGNVVPSDLQISNASPAGFGVGNNVWESGEKIIIDITGTPNSIESLTLEVKSIGTTGDVVTWIANLEGGGTATGSFTVTGDGFYTVDDFNPSTSFTHIELSISGSIKIGLGGNTIVPAPSDVQLSYEVIVTDGDGDTATNSVNVYIEADGTLVQGDNGDNLLVGGAGNDTIVGYLGNDSLSGGAGNDLLFGGSGLNTLTGGVDIDIFFIDKSALAETGLTDVIVDYAAGDLIDLSELFTVNAGVNIETAGYVDYNSITGELKVDADGSASAGLAVTVATLTVHPGTISILYDENGIDKTTTVS